MRPFLSRLIVMTAIAGATALAAPPAPATAQLFVNVRVNIAPPPLPIYDQPPIPGPDYIWVPGFWAWDDFWGDYYWVPGTWVLAPRAGYLWTPPWWGWENGVYVFHSGYWGPHIGFYGGVAYGFGYDGRGYEGGFWRGPHFVYNKTVNNITNVNITNVYLKNVTINRTNVVRTSYSGGPGGVAARPTPEQLAAAHEAHLPPTNSQGQHIQMAHQTKSLFASQNHGAPPIAAAPRPAVLRGPGIRPASASTPRTYVAPLRDNTIGPSRTPAVSAKPAAQVPTARAQIEAVSNSHKPVRVGSAASDDRGPVKTVLPTRHPQDLPRPNAAPHTARTMTQKPPSPQKGAKPPKPSPESRSHKGSDPGSPRT